MRKLFQIASLFVVLTAESVSVLEAQDVSSKVTAQDLMDKNWVERAKRILEISVAGLTNAKQKAELVKLKPSADDDPRYVFAFVLVAMKEKQWASALKNTTEVLERHKDYIPARVAQARLLLTQDKKLVAVTELELLAKGLNSTSDMVSSDQLSGSKLRQARAFSTYDDFNFHKEQTLLIVTLPKD